MPFPVFAAVPLLTGIGAFFSRIVASRIGFWVLSAFAFFGIQMVATSFVIGPLLDQISLHTAGAPAEVIAWLRYLNIDRYFTMVMSAYAAAAAAGGLRMRKTG